MFEQSTLAHAPVASRLWSTGAGLAGEALLVTIAALAPMVVPQVAPKMPYLTHLVFPGAPPPSSPPPSPSVRVPRALNYRQFRESTLYAPVHPPATAQMLVDDPADFAPVAGAQGGVAGGVEGGVPGGIINSILTSAHATPPPPIAAPPPPEPKPLAAPPRVRVGGLVKPAEILSRAEPVYPPMAIRMRISGTVQLEGVIGTDGRIRELRVLSGHPMLVKAAIDAVRQWVYRATTLNGDAVEVISPINVTFRLN